MPVTLISNIIPPNNNTFFMVEDLFLKGGYQVREDVVDRDNIDPLNRKAGMAVFTQNDSKLWILQSDLVSWLEFSSSGSGAQSRIVNIQTSPEILPGDIWDFQVPLGLGSVAVLLRLEVSLPCAIEIHSTPQRNDSNPFKFIGITGHLKDDGSTLMSDGSVVKGRRYSILASLEDPVRNEAFGRMINLGLEPIQVTITMDLLPQ